MGDLNQVKYNEAQKLAEKQRAAATAPAVLPLFARLSQTGIPVAGASILGSEIEILIGKVRELEARLEFLEHHSG